MGDRRPSWSSWFWSSTPRRAPLAQTTAPRPSAQTSAVPPPTATAPAPSTLLTIPEAHTTGHSTATSTISTSTTPPISEPQTPTMRPITPPPPAAETQTRKEVKEEVLQATSTKANEETTTKKEAVNDFSNQKLVSEAQIIEKPEVASKPDWMQMEKLEPSSDKTDSFPTSLLNLKPITNARTSQPRKKSTISDTLPASITDDVSPLPNRTAIEDPKSVLHDRAVSMITLAGENRGASMQMGPHSSKRQVPINIHRRYKRLDKSAEATNNGEGSSNGKKSEDANDHAENQPTEEYINNNAQGINNSIVFDCSISERDPGVHIITNHGQPIEETGKTSAVEKRKAEFNTTRADHKRAYEPTVRRRCLRGLLMESSDSDAENPKKPRRHGCRVGCKENV